MRNSAPKLELYSEFLTLSVALALVAVSMIFAPDMEAQSSAPASIQASSQDKTVEFDVVSIRPSSPGEVRHLQWGLPNGYSAKGWPLLSTIIVAYSPPYSWLTKWGSDQIYGVPPWAKSDSYDIDAKIAAADVSAWRNQGAEKEMLRSMLQTMLRERCKLVVHHTTVEVPVYALTVGKHGTKLKEATHNEPMPSNVVRLIAGGLMVPYPRGGTPKVTFLDISMESFAAHLSAWSDRRVVDRTGLTGSYDFELQKREGEGLESDPDPSSSWNVEELGLKLVAMKLRVDALMIDHIEKPSEN